MISEARRFNVAVMGRRFGKTVLGEGRAAETVLRGQPAAYFAPTYKMLAEVWRDLYRMLKPVTTRVNVQERRLELVTGGILDFWSLDTPDAARGRKYGRVIIDEAAMVPDLEDAWQYVIRPTLTDLRGDAWFFSTPRGYNYFHTLYERGQSGEYPEYASWQLPTAANPHIPPDEIKAAAAELPEATFAQEYLAQFVSEATAIFKPSWWETEATRYDADTGPNVTQIAHRWLSYDTAFKENDASDYTAWAVLDQLHDGRLFIREVGRARLEMPGLLATMRQHADIWNRDGKLKGIVVEDKGSGTSATQTLRAAGDRQLAGKLYSFMPRGKKTERARQASVWCERGAVLLPWPSQSVPWLANFAGSEGRLYAFPAIEHDDEVDALVQGILWLQGALEVWNRKQRRLGVAA